MNGIEAAFPRLKKSDYRITSPIDNSYNCVAWAANDTTRFWWPDANGQYFWPADTPRECTLSAFIRAYGKLGFGKCPKADPETGFEKIAIFAGVDGSPTHAARQLPSGRWTSKLGRNVDIEHTLHDLAGDTYGTVVMILKRPFAETLATR